MSLSFGYFREGDRVISVGGREPASVEEAVEGIRLGGRTVHLLVRFCLCLGLCLCPCLCLCLCGGCGGDQTWREVCSSVGLVLLFKLELVAPAKRYPIPDCTFCLI